MGAAAHGARRSRCVTRGDVRRRFAFLRGVLRVPDGPARLTPSPGSAIDGAATSLSLVSRTGGADSSWMTTAFPNSPAPALLNGGFGD
eukprot:5797035-Pyramimonas_sp.AAC.1